MTNPDIINAVVDVLRGVSNQKVAAEKYEIPKSTLNDYLRRSKLDLRINQPNEGGGLVSDPIGVYSRILVISDQHAPIHIQTLLSFSPLLSVSICLTGLLILEMN